MLCRFKLSLYLDLQNCISQIRIKVSTNKQPTKNIPAHTRIQNAGIHPCHTQAVEKATSSRITSFFWSVTNTGTFEKPRKFHSCNLHNEHL